MDYHKLSIRKSSHAGRIDMHLVMPKRRAYPNRERRVP